MIKYFHFYENGRIMTFADEPLPGALALECPADFETKGVLNYILVDGELAEQEPDPIVSEPLSAEKLADLARLRG
jgi:hypothetical protein